MPKYLYSSSYSRDGLNAIRDAGAQSRIDVVKTMVEDLGGSLEVFYYAFGEVDAYVVVDLPDDETAAAVALAVNGSATVSSRTTKLLTAAEIDAANARTVNYRAPGA
jgi:uncharacterized protein with GYD domain